MLIGSNNLSSVFSLVFSKKEKLLNLSNPFPKMFSEFCLLQKTGKVICIWVKVKSPFDENHRWISKLTDFWQVGCTLRWSPLLKALPWPYFVLCFEKYNHRLQAKTPSEMKNKHFPTCRKLIVTKDNVFNLLQLLHIFIV